MPEDIGLHIPAALGRLLVQRRGIFRPQLDFLVNRIVVDAGNPSATIFEPSGKA